MELVLGKRLILIRARTHARTLTRKHAEHLIQTSETPRRTGFVTLPVLNCLTDTWLYLRTMGLRVRV